MIRLFSLGGLRVVRSHDGVDESLPVHPKRHALLTYLALQPSTAPPSRDTLLALFWPESDDRRARDALKQLVRSLRGELGADVILSGRGGRIGLDGRHVRCDAVDFLHAAGRGDHESALELYLGDFLEGFHLRGAHDFEDWVARQRARLREAAADVARGRAQNAITGGQPAVAVAALERVLELQPFDESSLRALMQAHALQGERGRAIAAFEGFARRMEKELGASPSPDTLREAERVRVLVRVAQPREVTLPPTRRVPLAGGGVARPSLPRRAAVATLVAAAATVAVVGIGARTARNPPLVKERVLVDLFENLSGDRRLDHLERLATDHVTAGLTQTQFADVVTMGSSLLSRRGATIPADADPLAVAVERGAGTLVTGTYAPGGDSLVFEAQLVEVPSGTVISSIRPVTTSADDATDGLEALRDRVMAVIAAEVDPRLERWSRHATKPPSLAVYRTFVEGIESMTTLTPMGPGVAGRRALPLFLDAFGADSTFVSAAIWARYAAANGGATDVRVSLEEHLIARRAELAGLDRHIVDAWAAEDWPSNLEAWRRVVEIAPGSGYLKHAAVAAEVNGRLREAVAYRRRADPASGWLYGWYPHFLRFANLLHRLDECADVPGLAEQARRSLPDATRVRIALRLELTGYACLGDTAELLRVLDAYLVEAARSGWTERRSMPQLAAAAVDVLAHAPSADSSVFVERVQQLLTEAVEPNDPEESPYGLETADWSGFILYELGDLLAARGQSDSARVVLEKARTVAPQAQFRRAAALPTLVVLYLRSGELDAVRSLIAEAHDVGERRGLELEVLVASLEGRLEEARDGVAELVRRYPGYGLMLHARPHIWGALLADRRVRELIEPIG